MSTSDTSLVETHAMHGTGTTGTPDANMHMPAAGKSPALQAPEKTAPRLTSRQCQVLELLCEGLSDKLIARQLALSHHTVRGHVQTLYGLLQVSNRMQAMFAARRRGLIN